MRDIIEGRRANRCGYHQGDHEHINFMSTKTGTVKLQPHGKKV